MIVERSQKSDTNLGEIFEVGIRNIAGRAVVLDKVLVVLVIRSRELRERAQIFGRAGVGLQRTRGGRAGRIFAARTGRGGLGPRRAT